MPRDGYGQNAIAHRAIPIGHSGRCLLTPVSCISKMKVHPAMLMKTNKRCLAPGIRCQRESGKQHYIGRWRGILTPDCCLLPRATQKTKVTPEMLMKTKGDRKQVGEESVMRAGNSGFIIHDSKCGAKIPYDGISPEVPENNEAHDREQPIRAPKFRQQCTRVTEAIRGKSRQDIPAPESCLLTPALKK